MAGHRVRPGSDAGGGRPHRWTTARARAALTARRPGRGTGSNPRRRVGAPRPQAVERALSRGRAAGHRLRYRQGSPRHCSYGNGRLVRYSGVSVAGTDLGGRGRATFGRVRAGGGAGLRGHGDGAVRERGGRVTAVPGGAHGTGPRRRTRRVAPGGVAVLELPALGSSHSGGLAGGGGAWAHRAVAAACCADVGGAAPDGVPEAHQAPDPHAGAAAGGQGALAEGIWRLGR